MKTHVCLVSAQAAANLLPALDPALRPDRICLVVSAKMSVQARHLSAVLRDNGIEVELLSLTDEHDPRRIESELIELAAFLGQGETDLNITGGTKLMSVAAQSVASASDWRMFYVDVDTDQIIWLGRDAQPPRALTERLRLRHYLRSYGFAIKGTPCNPQPGRAQQELMNTLVLQIGSLEKPLSQLNWLAQQAEDRHSLSVAMNVQQQDSRSLEALLRNFADAGALTVSGATICFADTESRDFVKGGWLELYAYQALNALSGDLGIRDKAANLVVADETGVESELDIAFMARNRLFVIECKTARMDRPEAPKANDALFKLAENCRRIGGLGTRGMLVSYRALRDSEKKLARALNVELICGADVVRLQEKLKSWVRPA